MKAAILCSGKCVVLYQPATQYDVVIAVNRAINRYRADYWSVLDAKTLNFVHLLPHCPWITKRSTSKKMLGVVSEAPQFVIIDHFEVSRKDIGWYSFSSLAAIIFAKLQGARKIDCYRMDWAGKEDYDGFSDECQNRHPGRWFEEGRDFHRLKVWFAEEAIQLKRIT